jgi:glyoxylate carboligase
MGTLPLPSVKRNSVCAGPARHPRRALARIRAEFTITLRESFASTGLDAFDGLQRTQDIAGYALLANSGRRVRLSKEDFRVADIEVMNKPKAKVAGDAQSLLQAPLRIHTIA